MLEQRIVTEVAVIGSGVAGCTCALGLADSGLSVTLLSSAANMQFNNTAWAQGGIIYRGKADTIAELVRDILVAGDGQGYPRAVRQLAERGPAIVKQLLIERYGVPFTRLENGDLARTKEGGHSHARILYAADHTGTTIMKSLSDAILAHENIRVLESCTAIDLLTTHHHARHLDYRYNLQNECVGAYVYCEQTESVHTLMADRTVLATGGSGQVFLHTTNTPHAIGSGLAMANRAGAILRNVEYTQFHPTALYHRRRSGERCFLVSEALRGEGARLVNTDGEPFTHRYDERGDLAPRDVVTRAILCEMLRSGDPCVYLDAANYIDEDLQTRFPTIAAQCALSDIDISKDPIPVVPAAHYNCGGVLVNHVGRTTLERLYAVGEVACTGVHGANRLASTSLLEGLLWGHEAATQISERLSFASRLSPKLIAAIPDWESPGDEQNEDPALIAQDWSVLRSTMWNYAGIERSAARLGRAVGDLRNMARNLRDFYRKTPISKPIIDLFHGCETANIIATAALKNRKSAGCHYRVD
jgi:L-aspartate oxidase